MRRYLDRFHTVIGSVSTGLGTLAAVCLIGFTAFIVVCVVLRYVFNAPFIHADEINHYAVSWVSLLGLAYCLKVGRHISVDFVTSKFKRKVRQPIAAVAIGLGTVWLVIMAVGGVGLWLRFFTKKTFSYEFLHIELWIPAIGFLIALIALALQGLDECFTAFGSLGQHTGVAENKEEGEGEEQ